MTDAPLPPPAWYPDPSGVADLRYWDGQAWASNVVVGGQVTERPVPGAQGSGPALPPDDRAVLPGRAAFYGLGGFVVGLIVGSALALAADLAGLPPIAVLLLNLAGLWSGLLGACWLASRRYGSGRLARDYGLKFTGKDFSWGLLMSIAARFAGALVLVPFLLGPEELVGTNQGVYGEVRDSAASFLVFAAIAIAGAPLVEELFFRGLLLRSLTTAVGAAAAIALQALLFGLAHYSPLLGLANFSVIAVIAAAGVVFGITARWRRVSTSVAAHGFFNLVAVIGAFFISV
ncbi:MAG: CPBP family glutamic-type intramembrane protease [Actinomycetota bacterium]